MPISRRSAPQRLHQVFQLDGAVQVAHPKQQHLHEDSRPPGAPKAAGRLQVRGHGKHPHQVARRERGGPLAVGGAKLGAHVAGAGLRIERDPQEEPKPLGQAVVELDQVVPGVQQRLDELEHGAVAALGHQVEQLQVALLRHDAQHAHHGVDAQLAARQRQHLVQQRQAVAHAAVGLAGNGRHGLGLEVDPFAPQHVRQARRDVRDADAPEIEALATGEDRRRGLANLLGLGGGEHEDHPGRRLFQNLQQGVPRLSGEHVGLVQDVDLVAALLGRGVHGPLAQLPGVVHAPIGRGVDLHHVQRRVAAPDEIAVLALAARLALARPVRAVQSHGQNAGQRGLPHPPGAAEQVGVAHPVARDGVPERLRHVLLRRHFAKPSGAVLPG